MAVLFVVDPIPAQKLADTQDIAVTNTGKGMD
jgi:hypothetical protein